MLTTIRRRATAWLQNILNPPGDRPYAPGAWVYMCARVEQDIHPVTSANMMDGGLMRVCYRRADGAHRCLTTSVLGHEPTILSHQDDFIEMIRNTISLDNRLHA